MERQFMGAFMAAFGGLLLGGAVLQWAWFTQGRKYRRLAASLGPMAPRILYGVIGAVLIVFGILNATGRWQGGLDGRG